jgi:hypothetical protein
VASLVPLLPLVVHFDPAPDARVLAATLGFSLVATVVFGLGPRCGSRGRRSPAT